MSDDLISAEKARELLEAATPGRWDIYDTFSATQDGYGISVDGDQRPVALLRVIDGGTAADRDLAAAAPDLARTVVALHAEVERLRSIVEGRTTPPTDGEALDIFERGGSFRMVCNGESYDCSTLSSVWAVSDLPNTAWWAFDAYGRPCAWPGVTQ